MRPDEATAQIRNTVFKPGWRFFASVTGPDEVEVRLRVETFDTSYPGYDGQCRKPITIAGGERTISVRGLDERGLCYELIKLAADTNFHEDREFLKVRQPDGTWVSPLHPHTTEGELFWQRQGGAKAAVTDDVDPLAMYLARILEGEAA